MADDDENKTWHDDLPAELVAAPYFRGADNLAAAIADLTQAAETQGNSLRIPGPDADDAARAEFYSKIVEKAPGVMRTPDLTDQAAIDAVLTQLGKPAEMKDYALTEVDGMKLSDERTGELKRFAHESGLTKKQFDAFMGKVLTQDATSMSAADTAHQSEIDTLKGEWGATYDTRMAKVKKVLDLSGADASLIEAFTAGHLKAAELRMFHNLGERLGGGEGGAIGEQGKGGEPPAMTPGEAVLQLAELDNKLIGKFLPEDQKRAMMAKRMELIQLSRKPEDRVDDSVIRRAIGGAL